MSKLTVELPKPVGMHEPRKSEDEKIAEALFSGARLGFLRAVFEGTADLVLTETQGKNPKNTPNKFGYRKVD